jgi:hypothetical protein
MPTMANGIVPETVQNANVRRSVSAPGIGVGLYLEGAVVDESNPLQATVLQIRQRLRDNFILGEFIDADMHFRLRRPGGILADVALKHRAIDALPVPQERAIEVDGQVDYFGLDRLGKGIRRRIIPNRIELRCRLPRPWLLLRSQPHRQTAEQSCQQTRDHHKRNGTAPEEWKIVLTICDEILKPHGGAARGERRCGIVLTRNDLRRPATAECEA